MGFMKKIKRVVKRAAPAAKFATGLTKRLSGIVTPAAKTVAKAVTYPVRKGIAINKDINQMRSAYKDYQANKPQIDQFREMQRTQAQSPMTPSLTGGAAPSNLQGQYAKYLNSGKAPLAGNVNAPSTVSKAKPSVMLPTAAIATVPGAQSIKGAQQIQKSPVVK